MRAATVKGDILQQKMHIKSKIDDYEAIFVKNFESILIPAIDDSAFLIVDKNVSNFYRNRLDAALNKCRHLVIEAVEENKAVDKIEETISRLLAANIKRSCRIIAIGGGVIQDISGFIASILFRGIEWEFYPTTLLAQADSCIGSKTSVNIKEYKNQLGTFYPPRRVIVDVGFLKTLTLDAIKCGLGEIIKAFLLKDKEAFYYLKSIYSPSIYKDWGLLSQLIYKSLKIKKIFIEKDELDRDLRNLMNYGHTLGHAIESVTNYAIPHGQAVTIGMDFANYLSMKLGYLSPETYDSMHELLIKNFPDIDFDSLDSEKLLLFLSKDKKSLGKNLLFVLTKGIGEMFKESLLIDRRLLEIFRAYANSTNEEFKS